MKKLKIDFKNCYGIKSLEYQFDFTDNHKPYAIYAPNGVMKTSFAKIFQDLSSGNEPSDRIYLSRKPVCNVSDENGNALLKEQIFVINSYDKDFESKKTSTLLVNSELKKKYESIHEEIEQREKVLIKALKASSGVANDSDEILANDIVFDKKEFLSALESLKAEVNSEKEFQLDNIKYKEIFGDDKVVDLLESPDFKQKVTQYIEVYDSLLSSSNFFKKGVFNHSNAADIAKNLKNNGFFDAKHTVTVNSTNGQRKITTEKELEQVIEEEKKAILENVDLNKLFNEMDKKFSTVGLKKFRDYLEVNKLLIPEFDNLPLLKRKLWIHYLKNNKDAYSDLMQQYEAAKDEIKKIIDAAKKEKTRWAKVIDIFNQRFKVPFQVLMGNQDEIILKGVETANVVFVFEDSDNGEKKAVEKSKLIDVLSNGEKKALYILNLIFEIEARIAASTDTLFVIDDIADSFDYKNKYAIIQYLADISEHKFFNQIILTHNFDFYRTVSGRLNVGANKLHAVKSSNKILLENDPYYKNPFHIWKDDLSNNEKLIASICFIRNLCEYSGNEVNEKKLTSLLHIKDDTASITKFDLQKIINEMLHDKKTLVLENPNKKILELIYETADQIALSNSEAIDLEKKIVLSIAIRLSAEQFMRNKINNSTFFASITRNQTVKLIKEYKKKFEKELENIDLLEEVNLMTPENIHLNSFMYEPILDMSSWHLIKLYQRVKSLA